MGKPHGIHPDELAAMHTPGEKYQASNGTEGECFFDAWCRQCARDRSMREGEPIEECDDNERCDIIDRSMYFGMDSPEYPPEWVYGPDGQPSCTAFVPAGEPIPPPKDDLTIDMFGPDPLLNEAIRELLAEWDELKADAERLRAERDELRRQLAEAEQDARRYRWLRNEANTARKCDPMVCIYPLDEQDLIDGDRLDVAIDAAMELTRPAGES